MRATEFTNDYRTRRAWSCQPRSLYSNKDKAHQGKDTFFDVTIFKSHFGLSYSAQNWSGFGKLVLYYWCSFQALSYPSSSAQSAVSSYYFSTFHQTSRFVRHVHNFLRNRDDIMLHKVVTSRTRDSTGSLVLPNQYRSASDSHVTDYTLSHFSHQHTNRIIHG